MKPIRIRRRQWDGWKCPVGAVYCGRPSKYGNPFKIADSSRIGALVAFRAMLKDKKQRNQIGYPSDETIKRELKGMNLVCWCGLNQDCHVNDLLRIANS
jgi:hypothetical protein